MPSTALDWLDRELPNVLAAARLAANRQHWSVAWQTRGRHVARVPVSGDGTPSGWSSTGSGLDAARAGGDALGEAKMLYRIGTALINAGQLDRGGGLHRSRR